MNPKPKPSPLLARHRSHLVAIQAVTARTIHGAFSDARRAVKPSLQGFTRAYALELARVRSDAEDDDSASVPLAWLQTSAAGLAGVRADVLAAAKYAASRAQLATTSAQQQAHDTAVPAAVALVAQLLPADEASSVQRAGSASVARGVGVSSWNGAPLATFFDTLPGNAWDATNKTLAAGVAAGVAPSALFASLLAASLDSAESRAQLIGEQEATGAWRDVVSATFEANSAIVGAWMWVAQDDACDLCAAQNGSIHDISEDLDSHPRCRCMQQPLANPVAYYLPEAG